MVGDFAKFCAHQQHRDQRRFAFCDLFFDWNLDKCSAPLPAVGQSGNADAHSNTNSATNTNAHRDELCGRK